MEETHYEKILVSSGEVPEETGEYITDKGLCEYIPDDDGCKWYIRDGRKIYGQKPIYWLKPYSPKEEAVLFAEWIDKNNYVRSKSKYKLWYMRSHGSGSLLNIQSEFTTEELYDKFKEGR